MTALQSSADWSPALLAVGIDTAVIAALVCLAAWVLDALVGRHRPAARSATGRYCLVILLLIPVAVAGLGPFTPAIRELPVAQSAATIVVSIYLAGTIALLARLAMALAKSAGLRRDATEIENPAWPAALATFRTELGLDSPVEMKQSDEVCVPVVIGGRRPIIVIPARLARCNDSSVIDAVLLHELVHVARRDYAWNLFFQLVQALYWPHPFVWISGLVFRRIREDACDAACVIRLGNAREYCAILVEVAAELPRRPGLALGLAMTRTSNLRRRLLRIDNVARRP